MEEVYQAIDEENPMYENFDTPKKGVRAGAPANTYGGGRGSGGTQEMYENFDVKKNAPRGGAPVAASGEQEMYENVDHNHGAKGSKGDDMPWLHGMLSREEVTDLFESNGMREGIFLVRESTKRAGDYVLSVFNAPKVQHFIIVNEDGVYSIDDGPKHHSLPELINYYVTTTDRLPTRLVTPIRRTAASKVHKPESYEQVWEAGNSDQAQFGTQLTMGKGSSLRSQDSSVKRGPAIVAVEPGDPYSVSDSVSGNSSSSSLKGKSAAAVAAPAASASAGVRRQPSIQAAAFGGAADPERGDFTNLPRVKKWIDQGDSINSVQLTVTEEKKKVIEGFSADASERAAIQMEKFSKAALAEEKMYLFWMNSHLKKIDKSTADISESIKNGCLILEVIKIVSGQPAPMYAKRPTVMQQQMDNWHVVIKYMRKLGIQVDNIGSGDQVESVGLDADALFNLDRREILKLFSKLLMYENTLKK